MGEKNGLEKIETKCKEILGSPYMSKRVPGELVQLRSLLAKVETLSRDDVPALIAELRRLQAAEAAAVAEPAAAVQAAEAVQTAQVPEVPELAEPEKLTEVIQAVEVSEAGQKTEV